MLLLLTTVIYFFLNITVYIHLQSFTIILVCGSSISLNARMYAYYYNNNIYCVKEFRIVL